MANMITLTEMDYLRLHSILENHDGLYDDELDDLEFEVERARVIDFPEIPTDLVTMNSTFRYLNMTDNKVKEITLVYPQHADSARGRISVTAPLGMALLGLREGEEIDWTLPDGKEKRLKVLEILYQPESNGDLHL